MFIVEKYIVDTCLHVNITALRKFLVQVTNTYAHVQLQTITKPYDDRIRNFLQKLLRIV